MVRLKRSEMSVFKNMTIKLEGLPETEVMAAVLHTAVFFNSLNPLYDRFYYKADMVMTKMGTSQLRLEVLRGAPSMILKFGTKEIMEEFCTSVRYTEGIWPPCHSLASSETPTPPSSLSIPAISLSPSLSSP